MSFSSEQWLEILQAPQRHQLTVTEVCRRYQVSRKSFYVYLARYREQGNAGLRPNSRRPKTSPGRSPSDIEAFVVRIRRERPRWGARRIREELRRCGAEHVPAASTVHAIMRRHGLVGVNPEGSAPVQLHRLVGLDHATPVRALRVGTRGAINYRRRRIQVGAQLVDETVHAVERNGIVRIFHGADLIRELRLGPTGTYHGNGKKSTGRPPQKRTD
ncbi:helix-turn-helix domain-containing protein [Nocardia sp. NPDC004711]